MLATSVFGRLLHFIGYTRVPCLQLALAMIAVTLTPRSAAAQALPQRVQQLEQQVSALAAQVAALEAKTQPAAFLVDCTVGDKINDAIAEAAANVGQVTIFIRGTCVEKVSLNRSHTSLVGLSATGATIQAPSPGDTELDIGSALDVVLSRLTLTGGHDVTIRQQSDVHMFNVKIVDHSFHGLFVTGSSVLVRDSFVERNGGTGLFAWNDSNIAVDNTLFADNGETGLGLSNGSIGQVQGGSRLTQNQHGIGLSNGSALSVADTTIVDNAQNGLDLESGSSAEVDQGVVIQGNGFDGVHISDSSVLSPLTQSVATLIQNNGGWGVNCSAPPEVPQLHHGASVPLWFSATGNALGTINCLVGP